MAVATRKERVLKATDAAMDAELLTRRETADLLRVSQSTLSRWSRSGEGPPCVWISRHSARYLRADVTAFLERNRAAVGGH